MRIGLAEQTLLAALGQAAVYTQKDSTPPPNIQSPLEEVSFCPLGLETCCSMSGILTLWKAFCVYVYLR